MEPDAKQQIADANNLVREGKYAEADEIYRDVLRKDMGDVRAWYGLGYSSFLAGDLDAAEQGARRAQELGHPEAELLLRHIARKRTGPDVAPESAAGRTAPPPFPGGPKTPPPFPPKPSTPPPFPPGPAVPPPIPEAAGPREALPWETPPSVIAKVEAYDTSQKGTSYPCKCREFLNGLLKNEATPKSLDKASLVIYPDIVGVAGRPGCLDGLAASIPEKFKPVAGILLLVASFALWILGLLLSVVLLQFDALFMLIGVLIALGVGAFIFVAFFPYSLVLLVLLVIASIAWNYYNQMRVRMMIERILANPKGPYAVRKLFKLMPTIPRFWRRGDAVQLVRVDMRQRLRSQPLLLIVQDNPIPQNAGCMTQGGLMLIGRLFTAERRIYVLSIDAQNADEIAAAISRVLGLPVVQGKFRMNSLRLA